MSESPFAPAYTQQVAPPTQASWWNDARAAVATMLALAAGGIVVGIVWAALAPRLRAINTADGIDLVNPESKAYIGQDAYFLIITAIVGVVCGIVVWWLVRGRGAASAVALALGGLAGAYIAWRVGRALGPTGDLQSWARTAPVGATRALPVDLRATAVLMAWPLMGVLSHLGMVLITDRGVSSGDRPEPPQLP